MIYVISPYTHEVPSIMYKRYKDVMKYTAELMNSGLIAFSPIVHCHQLAIEHELPKTFEFWEKWCIGMLDVSTEVHLLMLDGWTTSKGVKAELDYSDKIGIPIKTIKI